MLSLIFLRHVTAFLHCLSWLISYCKLYLSLHFAINPLFFSPHCVYIALTSLSNIFKSFAYSPDLFPILTPPFFHFAPLLLLPPPLMSFHISLSLSLSTGCLSSSLGLPLSLRHTPDAPPLAPVCPKGLIDSER